MVGGVDHDELFRLGAARVEGAHVLEEADLVELALDEKLRLRAALHGSEIVARDWRGDADQRGDPGILGANRQRDPCAERHAGGPDWCARILPRHVVERSAEVVLFARAVVERSLAGTGAAEVEPQHGAADPAQRLRRLIHDLRVHRPALRRQRVGEHDGGAQAAGMSLADAAVVTDAAGRRRFLEQRLEPAGRSRDLTRRHDDDPQ